MKFLYLVGIDFPALVVAIIILIALGFGIFFLSRMIIRKVFAHFSDRKIFAVSICFALVLAPFCFGLLIWMLMLIISSLK
jgi:hypothetical protein